jgi:hypothetical protein
MPSVYACGHDVGMHGEIYMNNTGKEHIRNVNNTPFVWKSYQLNGHKKTDGTLFFLLSKIMPFNSNYVPVCSVIYCSSF